MGKKMIATIKGDATVSELQGFACDILDCRAIDEELEEYEYLVEYKSGGKSKNAWVRDYDLKID